MAATRQATDPARRRGAVSNRKKDQVEARDRGGSGGFRPDIEGLRAVAIILVLLYHGRADALFPGGFVGVDVFFVISGFLITGLLMRELEKRGRVSLPRFYARRAKRLLPAAGLVLVVTAVLTWWSVSVVQWRTFGGDIVGAALYVVNWVLAARSVDYLAEDVGASPVQHFWSLAVEEQFYIVWPLLLVLVAWVVRRRTQARLRPLMGAGIALVIIPSFVYSVVMTASNPQAAFFVTPTRLWELGVGALVAIGAGLWANLPHRAGIALSWSGLVAVLASGVLLTTEVAWPGYAAAWPVLGSAAVIIGGFTSGRAGAAGVLSWKPAVWVGGLSYSLYLWHWPLLIAATGLWGELGAKRGLLVAAFSFIPAWLSFKLVENPIRFATSVARSNRLALSIGLNFSLIGVTAGLVLSLVVPQAPSNPQAEHASGAAVLDRGDVAEPGTVASLADVDWFTPEATLATESVPSAYANGCQQNQTDAAVVMCEYGDLHGDTVVAVVGDSKVLQWESAIEEIADDESWHMQSYTKSSCVFSAGMQVDDGKPYESCEQWNRNVLAELIDLDPDVVLVSGRTTSALTDWHDPASGTSQAMTDALAQQWRQLTDAGIPVVAILDNPSPDTSVYECVAANLDDLQACTFDRRRGFETSQAPLQLAAAEQVPGVQTIDMTDRICPEETCVPVIGNVLVYRQTSHLTDTYVRTLTPYLAEKLIPAVNEATG